MKQITFLLLAALTIAACNKEVTSKVNASSVSNILGNPLPVEWYSSCYDGENYNAEFAVYGGLPTDSVYGWLSSNTTPVFLGVCNTGADTFNISIPSDVTTDVKPVAFIVQPDEDFGSKGTWYYGSVITESCETPRLSPELRKTLLQKLKDRMNNLKGN